MHEHVQFCAQIRSLVLYNKNDEFNRKHFNRSRNDTRSVRTLKRLIFLVWDRCESQVFGFGVLLENKTPNSSFFWYGAALSLEPTRTGTRTEANHFCKTKFDWLRYSKIYFDWLSVGVLQLYVL